MFCFNNNKTYFVFKGKIVALDKTRKRLERLNRTINEFFDESKIKECIETGENTYSSDYFDCKEMFDKVVISFHFISKYLAEINLKVLVDAPCTNDRHSLFQIENNIFSKIRKDERSELPNIQSTILM